MVILNTEFGLIWATPWPDEKQLFLKFSKIRNSRNSQNSVWILIFFLGKLYQKLFGFTLSLHWWYPIPSLVWFGQLLDPMKRKFFKILKNSQFAKFAKFRIKNHFFPRHSIPTTFCFPLSLHCWYSIPSLVWFGQLLDPLKKNLKFSKIRNSRNSHYSVWKPKFFLARSTKKFFDLHSYYTGDTPYRVWFNLDNSLTRWKKPVFKILFLEIRKIPYENPIFFRGKFHQFFFCFTLSFHWWYSIPSLVWFGQLLDPIKMIFFKILKISQFAKFAKFRMKNHFFPMQAIPTTFGFTLSLNWWYSIPRLVWFGQLLNPMKRTYF